MQSNRVRLVAVPGYPVIPEKKEMDDDESAVPSETTPYAKDGSIWVCCLFILFFLLHFLGWNFSGEGGIFKGALSVSLAAGKLG